MESVIANKSRKSWSFFLFYYRLRFLLCDLNLFIRFRSMTSQWKVHMDRDDSLTVPQTRQCDGLSFSGYELAYTTKSLFKKSTRSLPQMKSQSMEHSFCPLSSPSLFSPCCCCCCCWWNGTIDGLQMDWVFVLGVLFRFSLKWVE